MCLRTSYKTNGQGRSCCRYRREIQAAQCQEKANSRSRTSGIRQVGYDVRGCARQPAASAAPPQLAALPPKRRSPTRRPWESHVKLIFTHSTCTAAAVAVAATRRPIILPMETAQQEPAPGSLSWRLSSHPITLLTFLFFRICTSQWPASLYTSAIQAPPPRYPPNPPQSSPRYVTNTSPPPSVPPSLHPRPTTPNLQLRPHLHHHHLAARHGLLLPQEHCGPPPCRAALVERGRRQHGRWSLGV